VVKFTDLNFEKEVLQSDRPVLVDLWAEWCGPCRMMDPIIDELVTDEKFKGIKIGKLNIDENPQTASKYGVMSIPTLILFKNGEEVKRLVGARGKEEIMKEITSF